MIPLDKQLTIIVPTMNRPQLLLRLLSHFDVHGFSGKIVVGDSSSPEIFHATNSAVEQLSNKLRIKHYHFPDKSAMTVIKSLTHELDTKYAVYLGDDDFLIPKGLEKCLNFLDNNQDYIAAHGIGVLIALDSNDFRVIQGAGFYPQASLDEGHASERYRKLIEDYSSILFSIHRTDVFLRILDQTPEQDSMPANSDRTFCGELIQASLSAVYGKIKEIDTLYLVRQTHSERYLLPQWFQWITGENWLSSYNYFRDTVAREIADQDKISLDEAIAVVEKSFAVYLQKMISESGQRRKGIRRVIRNLPLPESFWSCLRRIRGRIQPNSISLESLLSPSSKYHEDFMPVYHAVTRSNQGSNA